MDYPYKFLRTVPIDPYLKKEKKMLDRNQSFGKVKIHYFSATLYEGSPI